MITLSIDIWFCKLKFDFGNLGFVQEFLFMNLGSMEFIFDSKPIGTLWQLTMK